MALETGTSGINIAEQTVLPGKLKDNARGFR
jgi:hypothetical protein